MELSIVIINYNSLKYLLNCLDSIKQSLRNCQLIYEIIIIDNRSNKGDIVYLTKLQEYKLIFNRNNLGFAKACNQGIKQAKGKYILFLNPDIIVLNRAIEKLLYFKKKHLGFAGGKLLNKNLSNQPSCGKFFSLPVVFTMLFLKGERINLTKFTAHKISKVDWVSGACLLGLKSDFIRVGGFDENIFLYMEDVDFLFRARKLGIDCYFNNKARFIHYGSVTSGGKQAVLSIYKGLIYYYKKHYTTFELIILKIILATKAIIGILLGLVILDNKRVKNYRVALKSIN